MTAILATSLLFAVVAALAFAGESTDLNSQLKDSKKLVKILEKSVKYFSEKRREAEKEADRLLGLYQHMRTENDKLQAKLAKFDRKRGEDGRITGSK